ncbi:hypothetical protein RRG08_041743 [Elysia crispata]|uniref:G-protein coupled receptors family 1 profile domain-containing protein n=1 Tax=Elysia crispata TaxID=231223 RepID=A0AAE0YYZ8_9GAST|nr:hypothetical protein RRG08_041743 [Elysia crispata]
MFYLIIGNLKWRAKHLYLLNLAIADLLVTLFCMPSTVVTILYRLWLSGLVMCKLGAFLQDLLSLINTTMTSGILFGSNLC